MSEPPESETVTEEQVNTRADYHELKHKFSTNFHPASR